MTKTIVVARGVLTRIEPTTKIKQVLLLRRTSKQKRSPNHWELPGGKINTIDNKEMRNCLVREFLEETSLKIKPKNKIHELIEKDHHQHYFSVEHEGKLSELGEIKLSRDHSEREWFELSEIEKIPKLTKGTLQAIKKALLHS
ncbi:MAG: NUDIX hydrolase [Candidatus Micrarchaeota archaeon]